MRSRREARGKIKSVAALLPIVRRAKSSGRTVVVTNGCFDLLHAGHIRLLEQAKRLGNFLIVAINSDRSVRTLKGPGRPIVSQRDRALVLAGLSSVDYVTIFDELTPARVIERLHPQVLVKGADWGASQIIGREILERDHGRVVRIPLVKGYSTSRLIARITSSGSRR